MAWSFALHAVVLNIGCLVLGIVAFQSGGKSGLVPLDRSKAKIGQHMDTKTCGNRQSIDADVCRLTLYRARLG